MKRAWSPVVRRSWKKTRIRSSSANTEAGEEDMRKARAESARALPCRNPVSRYDFDHVTGVEIAVRRFGALGSHPDAAVRLLLDGSDMGGDIAVEEDRPLHRSIVHGAPEVF